ncbi:hypothetical protein [Burkholderia gladioli]|uniref:hypothetical protein n=1 Tax=Burkholderia gladioli TaxID=28095 RepID=UPI00286EB8B6|nr:hypothetical protein [Burkholderia gladioli]
MDSKHVVILLNVGATVFSFAAAGLWLASTWITRKHVPKVDANGWTEAAVIETDSRGRHIDPFASARAQGVWNRWAAGAAGVAALCQGLVALLS